MATKKTKTGKGKDGGGKKPVWVDEEAHSVLKEWAGLTRTSMVDAASALVMESLADGGQSGDVLIGADEVAAAAPAPAPATPAPAAAAPEKTPAVASPAPPPAAPAPAAAASTPAPAPAPRKKRTQKTPAPGTIKQHVGGVWLV